MKANIFAVKPERPVNNERSGYKWYLVKIVMQHAWLVTREFVLKYPVHPISPVLCVYRSLANIRAQIIDDVNGVTLVSASTLEKAFEGNGGNKEAAKTVGKMIAEKAMAKGIKKVVFDRGGYIYHGRVKELADGAREGGLEF